MKGGLAELLNFKQKNKDMDEFIKVPVGEKLSYCFGDPALTLMYTMTSTLLIYFYTNVVGISAGAVGMIMLISRIFDGFSDVAMGTIIDRTHSKYGKHASGSCALHSPMRLQPCCCLPCRISATSARSFMHLSPIT